MQLEQKLKIVSERQLLAARYEALKCKNHDYRPFVAMVGRGSLKGRLWFVVVNCDVNVVALGHLLELVGLKLQEGLLERI